MVYRKRHLPEGEGVCANVVETELHLLNGLLEGADRLCIHNFDQEYLINMVIKYPAVELECGRHEVLFSLSDDVNRGWFKKRFPQPSSQ